MAGKTCKQNAIATVFDDVAVLRRKWQAAVRPGITLPSYEEIMLGSLGRLSDHVALLKPRGQNFDIVRCGRYVEQWLGLEVSNTPLDVLPADCALALSESSVSALKNEKPHLAMGHCVRDGMMRMYDVFALPMQSRWGTTYVAVYVNQKNQMFSLLDTIVDCSAEGVISLVAIRDHRGEPFDFQIVYANRGASELLAAPLTDLQWSRLSLCEHLLHGETVLEQLCGAIKNSASIAFEMTGNDRSLRLGATVFGDLISLTLTDVTELKRRERSARLLFDDNPMPMWLFDAETMQFLRVNDAALDHYGFSRADFLQKHLRDIWPRDEWDAHSQAVASLGETYQSGNWHHIKADGSQIEVLTFGRRITIDGRDAFLVAVVDITERRKAEAQVAYLAHHDALTGLPNRVLHLDHLKAALDRGEQLAVLSVDLDLFKNVNDSFGHPVGDKLLRVVADRLRTALPESFVARIGGDEFAVVLEREHVASADGLASRLIDDLGKPYHIDGIEIVIGASVGIAVSPNDGTNSDELLRNADMALYGAKAQGRNTQRFFEPEMDRQAARRRMLETDLRQAFAEGQLSLHYQPLVDISGDRVAGFEALLRWRHPENGMISPAEFIPLAEDIGLIGPIGDWVLRQACSDAAAWPSDIKVAVNLSPVQFRSRALVQTVVSALAQSGLPATRLELEITESVFLAETEANLAMLHSLRSLGVRISMDDFGTGYSSLSYLRSFPFDKIKIDRSFVRDMSERPDCVAIVRAISGLGRSLNITTTAEGVETTDQLDRLRNEGCNEVQGYLFSAAMPVDQLARFLAKFDCPQALVPSDPENDRQVAAA